MAYQKLVNEYKKNAVNSASPLKLIIMLYDGAIRFMESGKEAVIAKDYSRQNDLLQRAQKIVLELMGSLDLDRGAEISKNLMSLYGFVLQQLINANIHDKTEPIDSAIKVMTDLRIGWVQLEEKMHSSPVEFANAA